MELPGTLNYVTLSGGNAVTAPVVGAFSLDDKLFFVSTAGDNLIHFVNTSTFQDTQQINPNLPACTPGSDPDCLITTPTTNSGADDCNCRQTALDHLVSTRVTAEGRLRAGLLHAPDSDLWHAKRDEKSSRCSTIESKHDQGNLHPPPRWQTPTSIERLAGFFEAIGFARGPGWKDPESTGASFLAPLGNLEFVHGQFPSVADLMVEVTSLDSAHQAAAAVASRQWRRVRDCPLIRNHRHHLEVAHLYRRARAGLRLHILGMDRSRQRESRSPSKATSPRKA